MSSRRRFLGAMGATLAGAGLVSRARADHVPEPVRFSELANPPVYLPADAQVVKDAIARKLQL